MSINRQSKKIKINKEVLSKKTSKISYAVILLGFISSILTNTINIESGILVDIFYAFKILGILGFFFLAFVLLNFINFLGFDRHKVMGLAIGLSIAVAFILTFQYTTLLNSIEEFSIDARFRLSSFEIQSKDVSSGVILQNINPKAHPAIKIIGIDQTTVNEYQGYPFPWQYYVNLLNSLNGSNYNTVMFDIFFLDEIKNNFGLLTLIENIRYEVLETLYTNKKNKSISLSYNDMLYSSSYFSDVLKENQKAIVDYPFETGLSDKEYLESSEYKSRLEQLKKFTLSKIIPTDFDNSTEWVNHPEPPLAEIGNAVQCIGFANIRKHDTGVNRTIPLVIKWENQYYPSIDLCIIARYYGIDYKKDIEIEMGKHIKIKNIPNKKIKIGPTPKETDIMYRPNKEREITIPIDEEGFMFVNFIGGPWSFPSHSFVNIAEAGEGAFAEDDPFSNMILLTAMYYATGVAKDIHAGPFGEMAGIEHHANAINTILTQDFMNMASNWFNFFIYLFIGLAIGYTAPRYNMKKVIIGVIVFLILFIAETFTVFNFFNFVHHFIAPILEMSVVLIAITAYKVLTEEENVKYIRSTFSKFVSKDVVNELMANPESLKLGGEKKEITVFFSDIRGFTGMSEALTPEDLVHLLNDYLSAMTEIILGYKGTIDKYMGDAIMAFWGAPLQQKEHAYLACLASLKQMQELKKLQEKWAEKKLPVIDIGIGLNTGFSVAGNMGSSHRMDYTVMGDSINLGSRLEGTNKMYGTNIIISEYTYEKVKDKIIARELDSIRVKGKIEPVTIYELIDIKNEEDYANYIAKEI
ncbi:MAG: adenylate/guanylate cyclase domain-containing protein [Spirochaetia bacterium]|nr:adenylate/guanylate cyclase domain-containing protein [Spirochaetia bacterium]